MIIFVNVSVYTVYSSIYEYRNNGREPKGVWVASRIYYAKISISD